MVEKHMADDGYNYPDRFVGFGFYYNPQSENPNTITSTVEGSSAAAAMKVGDVVLSLMVKVLGKMNLVQESLAMYPQ